MNCPTTATAPALCQICGREEAAHAGLIHEFLQGRAPREVPRKDVPACGGLAGNHRGGCALGVPACGACGGLRGNHRGGCALGVPACGACGGLRGHHRGGCALYRGSPRCGRCGEHARSARHREGRCKAVAA